MGYLTSATGIPQLYQIASAPDQPTTLDKEQLSVGKLTPGYMTDGTIAWMPMDEDIDPGLRRANYNLLGRSANLLNKNVY